MSYLLDTNVISELVKIKPNQNVIKWFHDVANSDLFISVLTLGEIRAGVEKVSEPKRRSKLLQWLEHDLPAWFENRLLPVNNHVADRWGRLQAMGKKTLPAIDSLLAATALTYDLKLVTRNTQDFDFPFMETINPWE
jgi:predicted nucleic acid-binding protein